MRDETITKLNDGGREIALTADTLCKHTLFIGSTGSGKTTSLNALLRGLIAFRADDKKRKIGLLLFDFKNDGTLYKIKKWARECGRMRDVVDFSGGGHYINPFAEVNSPAKASEICRFPDVGIRRQQWRKRLLDDGVPQAAEYNFELLSFPPRFDGFRQIYRRISGFSGFR